VDGIERSDVLGKQGTCGGQDSVVHSREVESAEDIPASSDGIGTEREKCSSHLGSRESTGDERTTASQKPSKRGGLGLSNDELHDGGRI
jgi:hypothetical protein